MEVSKVVEKSAEYLPEILFATFTVFSITTLVGLRAIAKMAKERKKLVPIQKVAALEEKLQQLELKLSNKVKDIKEARSDFSQTEFTKTQSRCETKLEEEFKKALKA